jgi:hypothetical protein
MKAAQYRDDELVIQQGVELLLNGLGPLETWDTEKKGSFAGTGYDYLDKV